MAQVYAFTDSNGETRLLAEIHPDPAGTPFNGGTITQKLTIDGAALVSKLLDLISTGLSNWEVDVTKVDNGGGVIDAVLEMRADGGGASYVRLRNGAGDSSARIGSDQITLDSNSNTATDTLASISSVFWGTLLTVFADHTQVGAPMKFSFPPTLQNHAAPSDGSLAAGDCALWFDQTNGAAATKLMAKGKSADGTVKTLTVGVLT